MSAVRAETSRARAACTSASDGRTARPKNAAVLKAYRWQYILSGAQQPHFLKVLGGLITEAQGGRIVAALKTLQPS